jgi:hypothetical protein
MIQSLNLASLPWCWLKKLPKFKFNSEIKLSKPMGFWTTAIVCIYVGSISTIFWLLYDANEEFTMSILRTTPMFLSIRITCWIFPYGCQVMSWSVAGFDRTLVAETFYVANKYAERVSVEYVDQVTVQPDAIPQES